MANSTREPGQEIHKQSNRLTQELSEAGAEDTLFETLLSFLLVSLCSRGQLRDTTLDYRLVLPSVSCATHYSSPPNHWQQYRPIH